MIIDTTVSLGNLITLVVFALGAISAFITLRMTVKANNKGLEAQTKAMEAMGVAHEASVRRIEQVRAKGAHELSELRLEVAKNYASVSSIEGVERRILDGFTRLEKRLDHFTGQNKHAPD